MSDYLKKRNRETKRYGHLIGEKYNRLTIVRFSEPLKHSDGFLRTRVLAECECGNERVLLLSDVLKGRIISCGCAQRDFVKNATHRRTHGVTRTRLYQVWVDMKRRCYNPKSVSYSNYGGRGIEICSEWIRNPSLFFHWAKQNGYGDTLEIDRINVNAGYSPINCRFVTRKINSDNKRCSFKITFNGETKTVTQWSSILGVSRVCLYKRIKSGWSVDLAFSKPERYRLNNIERISCGLNPVNIQSKRKSWKANI
jgi:hypothetical protein